jgi:hypothetical protein
MTYMTRALTIFVTLCAALAPAWADDLRSAARDAAYLCSALEAQSLNHCGTQMTGRGPAHSEARRAVAKMMTLRSQYMSTCAEGSPFMVCVSQADWSMGAGIADALNGPVTHLRSAERR